MNVVVLGATGFVGRHLVQALLNRNHVVTAVARNPILAASLPWNDQVHLVPADMYGSEYDVKAIASGADAVIDLIWPRLPNYMELFHFEENLPASYKMLKAFVEAGCKQVLVTGTCLEYGLQNGCLTAETIPQPHVPYAFAKDSLRKWLEQLREKVDFTLQWARLFYVYGEGQSPRSLLPLLDAAIDRGDKSFPMSGGEQLRDFLPIESAAEQLVRLIERPQMSGTFNICSGRPTSVRRLAEDHLRQRKADIEFDLGKYPYPTYEPMAFWGELSPELLCENQTSTS